MTYDQLRSALHVMGLRERTTVRELKSRHRELVKRYHPDVGNGDDTEKIREVNEAYRVLLDYVTEFRFLFTEDEFYEQNPDERLRQQFMDVPMWGKK